MTLIKFIGKIFYVTYKSVILFYVMFFSSSTLNLLNTNNGSRCIFKV